MINKKIARQSVALLILLSITIPSISQSNWDTLPYKAYSDYKLQQLNKSLITTNILYDRVFPVADIERFKQQEQYTDTSSLKHWTQAYYELFNAAYNNSTWVTPDNLDISLDINPNIENGIPIGILNYKYNVMDTNAYVDHLIDTLANGQFVDVANRPRSSYFTQSTDYSSPLICPVVQKAGAIAKRWPALASIGKADLGTGKHTGKFEWLQPYHLRPAEGP